MSISVTEEIQQKIQIWKKRLVGDSNSNPLVDFRKNKKPVVNILTDSSSLYSSFAGDDTVSLPFSQLETEQTDTDLNKILDELRKGAKSSLAEKGFNSLFLVLGTLTWFDPQKPNDKYVSPILLVPVKLEKKGRKLPEYTLYSTDEDTSVNFLLINKLSDDFNITLPDSDNAQKLGYEAFLDGVRHAIAIQPDWQLEETTHLTLFQDAKAAMIQDLKQNQDKIAGHPILQRLASKRVLGDVNKPTVPQEQELDNIYPSLVYQIRDADSSQQVVIEAAKKDISCVVQGPPGTGKSQTIVNIIAELIGTKKKVLVVAEKQTALDVVFQRLKENNLEDTCLNLHHQGTTKAKDFFNELDQTITKLSQRTAPQQQNWDTSFKSLDDCRKFLNNHAVKLHNLEQPLNKSAFDLYGEILRLQQEDIPVLKFNCLDLHDWSETKLLKIKNLLEELGKFENIFRGKLSTIWSSSPLQYQPWSSRIYTDLRGSLDNFSDAIQRAQDTIASFKKLLKITEPIQSLSDLDKLQPAIVHIVEAPPGIENWLLATDIAVFQKLYSELKTNITNFQNINRELNAKYVQEFFSFDLLNIKEIFSKRFTGFSRFFNFLGYLRWLGAKRRERQRLLGLRQDQRQVSEPELIIDIDKAIERQNILDILRDPKSQARKAFGSSFDGEMTELETIERGLQWLETLISWRQLDKKSVIATLSSSERLRELRTVLENLEVSLNKIKEGFRFLREHFPHERKTANGVLEKMLLSEVEIFRKQADNELDLLQSWLDYQEIMRQLNEPGIKEFLSKLRDSNIAPNYWFAVLEKGVYENWLQYIHNDNYELRNFSQDLHERKINEFSDKDKQQYEIAIQRLRQLHTESWQEWSTQSEAEEQLASLKKETRKQKGQQKIRQFIKNAPQLVTTLKPCWLMSPLAVSQYIDADALEFDVVIFDEASQVCTEDAVCSIMRAKQVIVVGDDQQLPPTSFFKSTASSDDDEEEEIYESLLDECSALSIIKNFTLRWHYRSKDESLIAFSNQKFYQSKLIAFPNPVKDVSRGVHFHFVEDGIYDRGGRKDNIREAEEVAKLTLQHFRDYPQQSLGIITSNKEQAKAISEQINLISENHTQIEEFCQDNSSKFFIKTIEEVQGDERDVIFYSFGFGFDNKNPTQLNHNFGPLSKNQQNVGKRRLNVAITRAKCKFVLVASIKAENFDSERSQQAPLLKEYFAYARSRGQQLDEKVDENTYGISLPFEQDIYRVLTQKGYVVKKRVGRSAYPIDLVVIDNRKPETEECLLGIICDGTTYRKYPTARDRDRLREEVLEKLGWHIYRIWSCEWYRDRDSQINELIGHIEYLRNQK
ncbi:hypothetical protein DSM106972_042260 [Dulcicalothrix desertica PCC 7102]|uniref:RAP domain-containing protein n=1 Tax=Dulcicalothrix desertica PCC 7102 TaxID=232991 RepID=A0A3S1IYV1_9CYAN|nr:AAA domain-containing protein [Dulcicalothrix desertica]RUT04657.1 hypothetical protein DSM106972_042260 [Dulcicalothrix desertica PCC 7102]TWH42664.1 AAA domain-containing protein [Dulcicalothrix desertica PCC 7102]